MKHSIAVKFIAFLLCAVSLVAAVGSSVGIVLTEACGLYSDTLDNKLQERTKQISNELAWYHAQVYAVETLSNCPWELISDMYSSQYENALGDRYAVEVYQDDQLLSSAGDKDLYQMQMTALSITPSYPIVTSQYTTDENGTSYDVTVATVPNTEAADSAAETTASADQPAVASEMTRSKAEQKLLYSTTHYDEVWDSYGYHHVVYNLDYYQGPEYQVKVYLAQGSELCAEFALMELLYAHKNSFIPLLLAGLLLFAASMVFLCVSAGHTAGGGIRPGGLNRLPLDLYLLIAGGGCVLLAIPVTLVIEAIYGYNELADNMQLCILICALCALGIALLGIGFLYAFAAQVKVKGGWWWRHSVIGWALHQVGKFLRWISRGFGFAARGCRAVFRLLPVIWQWLLVAAAMAGTVFIFLFLSIATWGGTQTLCLFMLMMSILACIAVVCYGGYCFGTLMKGAKAMAQGDLNQKVNIKYMLGAFRDFATQLNSLADAAQVAAAKQMKSERMKTELITNVSHDIKTPLTSIINFVDLLKKPHSPEEGEQYLDVLDRQSQRLKKLIDDLMEMSKASSGNLSVDLGQVNAVEAVNQALGEFADKLDAAHLTPVFRYPDSPVNMIADGRLVWRVLSNLLSNAVKYALPDTRLYIDLMVLQGNAVIAIKNISRDQLNVDADELMERFVRGDTSRNTEGSGLGLNIAKSLVELQKGQMHLMVDGDLFKVTLIFPLS
ncbi:MAG: HAMP domain-containing histidine kinase [Oscillospiraceae bacterium]|nr:HAMP domain-containing histidine kinase [Oscillospiraceae bacterium]